MTQSPSLFLTIWQTSLSWATLSSSWSMSGPTRLRCPSRGSPAIDQQFRPALDATDLNPHAEGEVIPVEHTVT